MLWCAANFFLMHSLNKVDTPINESLETPGPIIVPLLSYIIQPRPSSFEVISILLCPIRHLPIVGCRIDSICLE